MVYVDAVAPTPRASSNDIVTANQRRPAYCRCRGSETVHPLTGEPFLNNCSRVSCWLHGRGAAKRRAKKERYLLDKIVNHSKRVFEVTFTLKDASHLTNSPSAMLGVLRPFKALWADLRRLSGGEFIGRWAADFKKGSGQLHYHALVNRLPKYRPSPTDDYPHRIKSQALNELAAKHGFIVWAARLKTSDHAKRYSAYIANNTHSHVGVDLPARWRIFGGTRRRDIIALAFDDVRPIQTAPPFLRALRSAYKHSCLSNSIELRTAATNWNNQPVRRRSDVPDSTWSMLSGDFY